MCTLKEGLAYDDLFILFMGKREKGGEIRFSFKVQNLRD